MIIDGDCWIDIQIKHDLFTVDSSLVAGLEYEIELRPSCPLFYAVDTKYGSLEGEPASSIIKGNCDQYRDILLMLGKPGHINTLAYIPADENHDEIRSAQSSLMRFCIISSCICFCILLYPCSVSIVRQQKTNDDQELKADSDITFARTINLPVINGEYTSQAGKHIKGYYSNIGSGTIWTKKCLRICRTFLQVSAQLLKPAELA